MRPAEVPVNGTEFRCLLIGQQFATFIRFLIDEHNVVVGSECNEPTVGRPLRSPAVAFDDFPLRAVEVHLHDALTRLAEDNLFAIVRKARHAAGAEVAHFGAVRIQQHDVRRVRAAL